jgi:hypothetical protein
MRKFCTAEKLDSVSASIGFGEHEQMNESNKIVACDWDEVASGMSQALFAEWHIQLFRTGTEVARL